MNVTSITFPIPETVIVRVVVSPESKLSLPTVAVMENWPTRFLNSLGLPFFGRGFDSNLIGFVEKILCLLCVVLPKNGSLKNLANGSLCRFVCVRFIRSSSIIEGGIVDFPILIGNNAMDTSSTS